MSVVAYPRRWGRRAGLGGLVVACLATIAAAAQAHPGDFMRPGAPIYLFRVTSVTYEGLLTFSSPWETGTVTVSHRAGRAQLPMAVRGTLWNTAELQPGRRGVVGRWSTYAPDVPFRLSQSGSDGSTCADTVLTDQAMLGDFRRTGPLVRLERGRVPGFDARGGYNGSRTYRCSTGVGGFDNLFPLEARGVRAAVRISRLRGSAPVTVVYDWERSYTHGPSYHGKWKVTMVLQPLRMCRINRGLTRCRANAFTNAR